MRVIDAFSAHYYYYVIEGFGASEIMHSFTDRWFDGPSIAALHVWVALIVPGCALDRLVCACFMY